MLLHISIPYTPAFVERFTVEALPHQMKKHIEEDLLEWEENLRKVSGPSVRNQFTLSIKE